MREPHVTAASVMTTSAARVEQRVVSAVVGVLGFVALMILGAHVRIPLPWTPVPVTLQTMFLHLAGASLGGGLGALSQALYLGIGAVGVPVFTGGAAGAAAFLGPTAGYLVGFVAAAAVTGWLVNRRQDAGILRISGGMACGMLVVYACGAGWLLWSLQLSPMQALLQGVVPFLAGDVVKLLAAAGLFRGYRRAARRARA
jgi:biotin transport system substrate-specific component